MAYVNTEMLSRVAEKLTEQLSDLGSTKPIYVPLWTDTRVPESFADKLLSLFGLFKGEKRVYLTVRYGASTGYTLEGPAWRVIRARCAWSVTDLFQTVVEAITDEYELSYGWEKTLQSDLAELESL